MRKIYIFISLLFGANAFSQNIDVLFDSPIYLEPLNSYNQLTINENNVNLREGPGVNYKIIQKLEYGAIVNLQYSFVDETIDNYNGQWTKVDFAGRVGFIYSKYLGIEYSVNNNKLIITKEKYNQNNVDLRTTRVCYNGKNIEVTGLASNKIKVFKTNNKELFILVLTTDNGGETAGPTSIYALTKKISFLIEGDTRAGDGGYITFIVSVNDKIIHVAKKIIEDSMYIENDGIYVGTAP